MGFESKITFTLKRSIVFYAAEKTNRSLEYDDTRVCL